jgi:prepilin-type processing-associated H-X9-DG protein
MQFTSDTPERRDLCGFTLIELLAIVAVVALAGAMLLPILARTQPDVRASQCLANAKQLAVSVQMYISDNSGFFPPNPDNGTMAPGQCWCDGNVSGGMPGDPLAAQTFNPDTLTNVTLTLLAPYLNRNAAVFSCPSDPRIGTYTGTNVTLTGKTVRAARSVSMNAGVGTITPAYNGTGSGNVPDLPVNGPWLTGAVGGNRHNNPWTTFGSSSDFSLVAPAQIFLIADEDPWSIDDAALEVSAGTPEWVDFPATFHDHGCTFSFCDGHVELHRWSGTSVVLTGFASLRSVVSTDPDWNWVWQHATILFP